MGFNIGETMKKKLSFILATLTFIIITMLGIQAFAFELPSNAEWINTGNSTCDHSFYKNYSIDANCVYDGETVYSCNQCYAQYRVVVKAKGHSYVKVLDTKARPQTSSNSGVYGETYKECKVCQARTDYKSIAYPSQYTLSYNSYVYNGKAKKPTVTVKDCNGNTISSTNYTVTYSNNIKVGKATAKITFKNNYTGTVSKSYKIKPTKPTLSSVKYISKGKITAKWKKNTSGTGYIVQYSTSSKFSRRNTCTVLVSKNTTLSKNITSLPAKKYYVRIASYKSVNGYKYRSAWSDVKSTTVKSGVSLKTMINHTKTDTSGKAAIKELTHGSVDISKYSTTYDRMKAIYDWHSKNNTKYFESCMDCNMSFNECLYYLYGTNKQYDDFIWLAAGNVKNSDGSIVMHKWPVIYIQGVPYIIDPRLQGYTSNKTGTTYFGISYGSQRAKMYLLDGYWFYWSNDSYKKIV